MFSALRGSLMCLVLSVGFSLPAVAHATRPGESAEQQIRHIATRFPGRMAGTPAEVLAADYIQRQFTAWGYQSAIRRLDARYRYTNTSGHQVWHNLSASSVMATHQGKLPQQIIIMAHLDTYTPLNDNDVNNNLGGLTLQGVDDNASGLGVMLALAERLKGRPTRYGIRFIATSGEEVGAQGAKHMLAGMSKEEQANTLLVINLDSLIRDDKLAFSSGQSTPVAVRKLSRDRAIALAQHAGIPVTTSPALNAKDRAGTGGDRDTEVFDKAGIPVLWIGATRGPSGIKSSALRQRKSQASSDEAGRHNASVDNLAYWDRTLPGRITQRSHDAMRILLPLIQELAKAEE